jgi:hypothetical protein
MANEAQEKSSGQEAFCKDKYKLHKMAFLFLSNRLNKPKGVKNAKRL